MVLVKNTLIGLVGGFVAIRVANQEPTAGSLTGGALSVRTEVACIHDVRKTGVADGRPSISTKGAQ